MVTTIFIGRSLAVQGIFVRCLSNGVITVRDGARFFTGRPANVPRPA